MSSRRVRLPGRRFMLPDRSSSRLRLMGNPSRVRRTRSGPASRPRPREAGPSGGKPLSGGRDACSNPPASPPLKSPISSCRRSLRFLTARQHTFSHVPHLAAVRVPGGSGLGKSTADGGATTQTWQRPVCSRFNADRRRKRQSAPADPAEIRPTEAPGDSREPADVTPRDVPSDGADHGQPQRHDSAADTPQPSLPFTDGTPTSDKKIRTARTIVVLGATEIIGKLSMLLIIIAAARILGVADFGLFSYALAVGALATVIPLGGYDQIVVQRASAEPKHLQALLAQLIVMRTILIVLVFAIICGALGLSRPSDAYTTVAGLLVVAAVILDTYTEAYRSAAAAMQRQNTIAVVHLLQRLLTGVWALTALLLDTGLLGLAIAYCAGMAVGPVAAMLLIRRQGTRADWGAVSVGSLVQLNRGTWIIGLETIVAMALFRLDMLFLGWLVDNRAVGIYAAAYRLLETAVFVCWTVSRAVFPLMAADPRPHRVRRYTERATGVLAAVFIPYMTVLLCRGHDVLLLLYGEQFADAGTDILRWLAPAPLLFGLAFLLSDAMTAAGPTLRTLTGAVIALAVNVVLNLLLIPRYGGIAAAFTTSLSYAVTAVVLILLGRTRMGRPCLSRTVLPAVVASGVAAGPLLAPWPLAPALLTAAVVYVPCWAVIARHIDPEQVRVLREMFRRRKST